MAKQGIKQAVSLEEILTLGIAINKDNISIEKDGVKAIRDSFVLMRFKYLTVLLEYGIVVLNSEKDRSEYLHICLVLGPQISTFLLTYFCSTIAGCVYTPIGTLVE